MVRGKPSAVARFFDDHFVAILLVSALGIVGTMLVVEGATTRPQLFTGFGLLNQDGRAGDFPASVAHNGTLVVKTSVTNHQGLPRLYRVIARVGDLATVIDIELGSTGAVPMVERQAIVNDGGTWEETIPVQFNASLVGMKKVIFELWVYDTVVSRFIFTSQFLHAWIDVLAP